MGRRAGWMLPSSVSGQGAGHRGEDRGRVPAEPVAKFMAATETTSGTLRGLSGMAHAHVLR